MLREAGLSFHFHYRLSPKLYEANQIAIDQKFLKLYRKEEKNKMFDSIIKIRERCEKLLWFDTTASTSILEPEILPLVSNYYKGLVLKNLNSYLKPFYSNRIFSDYYHKIVGIKDNDPIESLYVKSKPDLSKIKLFWNYSLGGSFGIKAKILNRLREYLPLPYFYSIKLTPSEIQRPFDISCRISCKYERESIRFQREKIIKILKSKFQLNSSPLSLYKYFKELRQTKISPSPFGWGEINYRDFEVITCGAALMKPSMEHIHTWPDFYIKDKTYISHNWDLNDFEEKISYFLINRNYSEIANNAQNLYRKYLYSKKGHDEFIERAIQIFS